MADGTVTAPVDAPAPAPASGASEVVGKRGKCWLPLESNPSVLNKYMAKLGFPTALYKFHDVLSVDDWALEMVPQPALAVMMLFPVKEVSEAHRKEEEERIRAEGQVVAPDIFYTKQTVGNACGTIAVFHAVGNASTAFGGDIELPEGSYFRRFFERVKTMTPDERADAMEEDDELEVEHAEGAAGGVTEAVMDVETHFICFIHKDGHLYELDGRKSSPINHGATSPATLLSDACAVVRQFMARDEGELRFTILALGPNTGDDEEEDA